MTTTRDANTTAHNDATATPNEDATATPNEDATTAGGVDATTPAGDLIVAATGGTITFRGGELVIPPNALGMDTRITAVVGEAPANAPLRNTVRAWIELGPSGTQFDPGATLTFLRAPAPPAHRRVVISWLDTTTNQWVDLPTTGASAPVAHFTGFALRWVLAGPTPPLDCTQARMPCGGDLSGVWQVAGRCPPPATPPAQPIDPRPECADSNVEYEVLATGALDFATGNVFRVTAQSLTGLTLRVSPGCLAALAQDCEQVETTVRAIRGVTTATCTPGVGTCECEAGGTPGNISYQGTWRTNGSIVNTVINAATSTIGFCVDNDTLWMKDRQGQIQGLVR